MNCARRTGLLLVISALFVVAMACGSDAPPDAEFAPRIEVMAPIDEAEVVVITDPEHEYQLRIVSGLPNACAEYKETHVKILGNDITVDVRNTIPVDVRVACAEIYGSHERIVELVGLEPSTDYQISVNGAASLSLTTEAALDDGTRSVLAPIMDFRLELTNTSPPAYDFIVNSGLESSCMTQGEAVQTRSGGRLFGNLIRVSLTNIEKVDVATECVRQFTPYEARLTLPGTFETGGDYEILINFDKQYEFKGGATETRLLPPTR
ncbi:MAG TPA: hypothetical protein QGI07_09245 [Dehalococcoidia bacterium]|jgi:hypothetical protein|nr:hypothetical protein [Chloroflexota bacterium]MDP7212867.1 hypothetical protein [Dehalococcoidia bacterium]MDP7514680.1 hypothetical protein [Dehalococcoidia bacterium]HCV28144.1 hypothetical protein [Dehalococcoidia bacterium]HJM54190.1 hypothetical protein [Dehalococcoidia bacterium]